jgi:hypothetical protein
LLPPIKSVAPLYQLPYQLPNLIAIGETFEANKNLLENIWKTCMKWAKKTGTVSAPKKSELLHFSGAHAECMLLLRLRHLINYTANKGSPVSRGMVE